MISDNGARSQPARNTRRTLVKYCACAWGLPAVVVVTCFALDYTDTVAIGYGKQGSCRAAFFFLHKIYYIVQIRLPHIRETMEKNAYCIGMTGLRI